MELEKKIIQAHRIVKSLTGQDAVKLHRICYGIQCAQNDLIRSADPFFEICMKKCKGICCKNLNINDVVNLLDLIYILAMNIDLLSKVTECSKLESIYTADCPFLKDGIGPCLFTENVKPERCILSFCSETHPIRREIKAVRSNFNKLSRFTKIKRPFLWILF